MAGTGDEAISVVIEKLTEIVGSQPSTKKLKKFMVPSGDQSSKVHVAPSGANSKDVFKITRKPQTQCDSGTNIVSPESGLESAAELSDGELTQSGNNQKDKPVPNIVFTTQGSNSVDHIGEKKEQIIVNLPSNLGQLNITSTKSLLDSLITLNSNLEKEEDPNSEQKTLEVCASNISGQLNSKTVSDEDTDNILVIQEHSEKSASDNVEQLYKCAKCDYCSNNKNYLKQHVELVHNAERPFKCPFCDYAGKRSHSLREHLVVHSTNRPYECVFCKASFRKKGHLTNHIKMHATLNYFECGICHEKYSEKNDLYSHLRSHTDDLVYPCDHCEFATTDKSAIYMHMHTHGNPEVFICDVCHFTAPHMKLMKEHMQSHENIENASFHVQKQRPGPVILMKCSVCGFTSDSKVHLTSHMLKHVDGQDLPQRNHQAPTHTETSCHQVSLKDCTEAKSTPLGSSDTSESKSIYKCSECSFTCEDAYPFITHMLVSHKAKQPASESAQLPSWRAPSGIHPKNPQIYTESKSVVKENKNFIHDQAGGVYRCTICGYTCEHQRTIKAHIWKHSGHQNIDYPMFQNGPLSMYDDGPISKAGQGTKHQGAPMTIVSNISKCQVDQIPIAPVIVAPSQETRVQPSLIGVSHPQKTSSGSREKQATVNEKEATPRKSGKAEVAKLVEQRTASKKSHMGDMIIEHTLESNSAEVPTIMQERKAVMRLVQGNDVKQEHHKEVYMQIMKIGDERENEDRTDHQEDSQVEELSNDEMRDISGGHEVLESQEFEAENQNVDSEDEEGQGQLVVVESPDGDGADPRLVMETGLETVEIIIESADSEESCGVEMQTLYALPIDQHHSKMESIPETLKRKMVDSESEEEKQVKRRHADDSLRATRGASVVVEELPQLNSPRVSSPRSEAAILPLSEASSKSSSSESLVDTGTPATLRRSRRKRIPKGGIEEVKPKITRVRKTSSTADEMITLLSLLKKGPNYNPACPPDMMSEGLEQEVAAEEVVDGSEDDKKQKKGGICSSLLAVIEQLRERSKSESEGDLREDASEGKSSGRSGASRKRGQKSSVDDDMSIDEHQFVETVESQEGSIQYRCKLCHYASPSPPLMKTHMKMHKEKKPFECSLCDHLADCSEDLQDHMLQHCKVRTYQCKACSSTFHYKSQLRAHMRAAHEKGPLICPKCSYETTNPISYQNHMRSHSEKCRICGYETTSPKVLKFHMQSWHSGSRGKKSQQDKGAQSDAANLSEKTEYACEHCERKFKSESQLNRHMAIHVQAAVYKCSECDFKTKNFDKMTSHAQNHVNMQCELCDFVATSSRSLKSHMKRHANDQRFVQQPLEQYKCNLCGYVCHHLPSLKSHMWRHATDCSYSYSTTNDVINAAIDFKSDDAACSKETLPSGVMNTGELTALVAFRCCQCGFESVDKAILNAHMKAHMDIIKKTLEVNKSQVVRPADQTHDSSPQNTLNEENECNLVIEEDSV